MFPYRSIALGLPIFLLLIAVGCSSPKTENFDAFFKKFMTDSIFQKSRITFPLLTRTSGIGDQPSHTDFIQKQDWITQKQSTIESTGYTKKIVNRPPKMYVVLYDKASGIGVIDEFIINEQGQWHLLQYYDFNAISETLLRDEN